MNKIFAALMTVVILGTVAVVFVLGIMSLGGLPENTTPEAEQITSDSALGHGPMEGYLHGEPPLNSAAFVPPPPSEWSARQPAASEALRSLEGSVRWDLATSDADPHFPAATSIFSYIVGAAVSETQTPAMNRLSQR